MNARIASIALGLLVASAPALARQAGTAKPAAAKAVHGAARPKLARGKTTQIAALPAALAAIPEAERRAIQADLVWLGNFEGMSAEEFDGHTLDAIKAFQKRNNGKETGVL